MSPDKPLYQLTNLEKGPEFSCRISIHASHPILKGHFPGQPVVPGAWLIRIVHEMAESVTGTRLVMKEVSQVKFLQPIMPDRVPELLMEGKIEQTDEITWKVQATVQQENIIYLKFKGTFKRM